MWSPANNVKREYNEIIKITKRYNATELSLAMEKIKCKKEQKQNNNQSCTSIEQGLSVGVTPAQLSLMTFVMSAAFQSGDIMLFLSRISDIHIKSW